MWSEVITLTTGGGTITFNATSGDVYYLIPGQCQWTPDVRLTVDEAPRTTGAVIFPRLKGAGHVRLGGLLLPATDTPAARDTMAYALENAADALFAATGTLAHPDRGTLTVGIEVYPGFDDWNGAYRKQFLMSLIAADPSGW